MKMVELILAFAFGLSAGRHIRFFGAAVGKNSQPDKPMAGWVAIAG
jgi:hypothetical protein